MHRMQEQQIDSKFRLILLAAERAEQLINGARPKISHKTPKVARAAMEEMLQGQIEWKFGPAPRPEMDLDSEGDEGEEPSAVV